jgi:hypothetical protein
VGIVIVPADPDRTVLCAQTGRVRQKFQIAEQRVEEEFFGAGFPYRSPAHCQISTGIAQEDRACPVNRAG